MKTRTLPVVAGLFLATAAWSQWPCDSVVQASFTASPDPIHDRVVHFDNTSWSASPNSTQYIWTFGDGEQATFSDVVHEYATAGSYTACLLAISGNCFDSLCTTVIAGEVVSPCGQLDAGFSVTNTGLMAHFLNDSPLNTVAYSWSFGDSTTTTGRDPVHTYSHYGQFEVCVKARTWDPITQQFCTVDLCEWVVIAPDTVPSPCDSLNAGFQVTTQGHLAFFHSSSVSNAAYQWTFGDGTSEFGPNPTHTYGQPGTYQACLTTWSWNQQTQDSCLDQHCEWVIIQGGGAPCDSLFAGFQATVQGNTAFFDTGFSPTDRLFFWSFGDGSSGTGPGPIHTYDQSGTYQVCLTVQLIGQDSCSAQHCEWITIQSGGSPCDSLNAGFQVTTQGHLAFFHSSSVSNAGYQWTFGDGTSGFGPNPAHTYSQPGTYRACLTTWSWNQQTQDSCLDQHCEWVYIQGGGIPCDSLFAGFQTTIQGNTAFFDTGFSPTDRLFFWSFGDGSSGTGPGPIHTYGQAGTYQVCLTVQLIGQDSCSAQHCEWITIQSGGSPCDSLNAGFQVTTQGHLAFFHSSSVSNAGYQWTFGDGTSGFGPNPAHTYSQPGTYRACLTTWSWNQQTQDSCFDEHCEWVYIQGGGAPCDSLFAGFQTTIQGNTAFFDTGFSPTDRLFWSFGDGSSGTGPGPIHTYGQAGTYQVCLTVQLIGQDSCSAQHCEWITIQGGGSSCDSLNAAFTWFPGNASIFFQDQSMTNGMPVTHHWSFGDGSESDAVDPAHLYSQPGQYLVCLTISTFGQGEPCSNTTCHWLSVFGGNVPCDSLNASFQTTTEGLSATFQATENNGQAYRWSFGDGTSGFGLTPTHTYAQPGQYLACLMAWTWDPMTQDSCSAQHCEWITIQGGPSPCDTAWVPTFDWSVDQGVFFLRSMTPLAGSMTSSVWRADGVIIGAGDSIVYQPAGTAPFTVCLTVTVYGMDQQIICSGSGCQVLGGTTSIVDAASADAISAYPQPFTDRLTLKDEHMQGLVGIKLMDLSGRIVDQRRVAFPGTVTLEYANLPAGPYLLRVQGDNVERMIRVVKQ